MYHLYQATHPEWHGILKNSLSCMDQSYLQNLAHNTEWLPGSASLFAAFSQPLGSTRYILLGESPYPRAESANGYAFWDGAVHNIWSPKGLSKEVNRATSLRNLIKMMLVARGDLNSVYSQEAIANLDKAPYWQTIDQLFQAMLNKGILLLNASLVYSPNEVRFHAKHWQPFMTNLFTQLADIQPGLHLILLGRIAALVPSTRLATGLIAEHPYNLSFISNKDVLAFFKPLDLLRRYE